jgi:hypothetical protein
MAKKYSLESHTIRVHPTVWKWAVESAEKNGYEGGASALISGLIIYDKALGRRHWLTSTVMNAPEELEKVLEEIAEHGLKDHGTWIEHRLQEFFEKTTKEKTPR